MHGKISHDRAFESRFRVLETCHQLGGGNGQLFLCLWVPIFFVCFLDFCGCLPIAIRDLSSLHVFVPPILLLLPIM